MIQVTSVLRYKGLIRQITASTKIKDLSQQGEKHFRSQLHFILSDPKFTHIRLNGLQMINLTVKLAQL